MDYMIFSDARYCGYARMCGVYTSFCTYKLVEKLGYKQTSMSANVLFL